MGGRYDPLSTGLKITQHDVQWEGLCAFPLSQSAVLTKRTWRRFRQGSWRSQQHHRLWEDSSTLEAHSLVTLFCHQRGQRKSNQNFSMHSWVRNAEICQTIKVIYYLKSPGLGSQRTSKRFYFELCFDYFYIRCILTSCLNVQVFCKCLGQVVIIHKKDSLGLSWLIDPPLSFPSGETAWLQRQCCPAHSPARPPTRKQREAKKEEGEEEATCTVSNWNKKEETGGFNRIRERHPGGVPCDLRAA
jgi:hypothetical protein